jgi:hypothetical protein
MSPLPTPEERRKRLQSKGLDDVVGRSRRDGSPAPVQRKSAAQREREEQRQEARRRASPRRPR